MKRRKHISKSEMTGFIFILIILAGTICIHSYWNQLFPTESTVNTVDPHAIAELKAFEQQIRKDSITRAQHFKQKRLSQKTRLHPFTFDPNTADSATLAKIGLKHWQISNIIRYREKGGHWRKPDDFAHLYGLEAAEFRQLKPYIQIQKTAQEINLERTRHQRDSIRRTYPEKHKTGTILSLNEADTTTLKGIPGIGSYYASKICRYRERLGGFVNVEQLREIEGLPKDIEKWFSISTTDSIRKTKINQTDFKGLVRHPYLNFEQVKVICNYIRKYGKIRSLEDLSNSEFFSPDDIERLLPYISFE